MAATRSGATLSLFLRSLNTSQHVPRTAARSSIWNVSRQSPPVTRRCPQCRRPYRFFSTSSQSRSTSKRLLTTESASAYRPATLDTRPSPPRNIGVPESSIAGGLKGDKDAQSKSQSQAKTPNEVSEQEARGSKPLSSTPSQSSSKSRPAGKSRLRIRKAAMTLTPEAVFHVRNLLDQPEPKLIRVGVKNKGCSGSSYHLEYVDKPGVFDELVEQDGVKVLIDSKALIKVIGSEMDWVEDKLSARFTFKNPNITEQCGCGESFSIS